MRLDPIWVWDLGTHLVNSLTLCFFFVVVSHKGLGNHIPSIDERMGGCFFLWKGGGVKVFFLIKHITFQLMKPRFLKKILLDDQIDDLKILPLL